MALERLLRCPTPFLSKQPENCVNDLLTTMKTQYDDLKAFETKKGSKLLPKPAKLRSGPTAGAALSSLLVDGFDVEQIWQQIELQNKVFRGNNCVNRVNDSASTSLAEETDPISDVSDGDEGSASNEEDEQEMDINDGTDEVKSSFERQQEKLRKRIEEYEEQILSEKPWQLKGEVTANKRPENSLLEEHVSYDHATKLPPVITQETTETLESLITQRIRDQAWDDVERKVKPVTGPYVYKNELTLDQEKPKMSLSQVYEQEFLKKASVMEEEKKNPKHEEIRKSMKELFFKLDLLTSSRYTPKPPMPELKVVNNMPSIRMEEVAPVSVSDAALLAPEEVKEKRKGEMKSKEERSQVDKKRELRSKKKNQKLKAARQREKETGKTAKTAKDKMKILRKVGRVRRAPTGQRTASSNGPTTSKDFFSQLQAQVKETVANGKGGKKKGADKTKKQGAAFKT